MSFTSPDMTIISTNTEADQPVLPELTQVRPTMNHSSTGFSEPSNVRLLEQENEAAGFAYWHEKEDGQVFPRWTLLSPEQRLAMWRTSLVTGENATEILYRYRFDSQQHLVGRTRHGGLHQIQLNGKEVLLDT